MTQLDPPAAAARRQNLLDRWVEHLVGWGCPLDEAPARARQLLDVALDHGYALPTVFHGPPLRGGGSTPEGRAAARREFAAARGRHRAPPERPPVPPAGADGYPSDPRPIPGAPEANERVP